MESSLRPLHSDLSATALGFAGNTARSKNPEQQGGNVTKVAATHNISSAQENSPDSVVQDSNLLSSFDIKAHNKEPVLSIDSILTPDEQKQLAWVQDNPVVSPEAKVPQSGVHHLEIFRATNRIHCLNLLRSGTDKDDNYLTFISPQTGKAKDVLIRDSFAALSKILQTLSDEQYEVLHVATILSSVTLSPTAKKSAAEHLNQKVPTDSVKFLSATAPQADKIYPLAKQLCDKLPEAKRLLCVAFMPDSHLRHMMNNEGSLAMYQHLKSELRNNRLAAGELNLWFMYWIINITGFRATDFSKGSKYLTQNIYKCIIALQKITAKLGDKGEANPMELYLEARAEWLGLSATDLYRDKPLALGSLAALLYVYDAEKGKKLYQGFMECSDADKTRWYQHTEYQLKNTKTPAPTYVPALFNKIAEKEGLNGAIKTGLPLFLDVIDKEKEMREGELLAIEIPVSFRLVTEPESIEKLIQQKNVNSVDIDTTTGCVSFNNKDTRKLLSA